MPFPWQRDPDPTPAPRRPYSPRQSDPVAGDLQCSEHSCPRHDAVRCQYTDRRRRECPTAWCPDHQQVLDGRAFCRRHASTLRAVGVDVMQGSQAPDLENRAPSLVNWICDDLDSRVRLFLAAQIRHDQGEKLGEERVHLSRDLHGRRWDSSWKLFNHTGITTKVTISVNEENDTVVTLRVGRVDLVSVTPPWIGRLPEHRGDVERDRAERRVFYDDLFEKLRTAVLADRADPEQRGWEPG